MARLTIIFSISLIACLTLLNQQVQTKVAAHLNDYDIDNTYLPTSENATISEYMNETDIDYETIDENVDKSESSIDEVIELDVGGQRITTFRSTLTVIPNSTLALLFSHKTASDELHPKKFVFDYNPVQFQYLLDQLRTIKRIPNFSPSELNIVPPKVDVRFNFSAMLYELGLYPEKFLSPVHGIHVNLSISSLIGWKECHRSTYDNPFNDAVLATHCLGRTLLVACRSISNKDILVVAAIGKRKDIFFPCSSNGHCYLDNNKDVSFYYVKKQAWGFVGKVPSTVVSYDQHYGQPENTVYLNPCDSYEQNSAYRLCWSFPSKLGRGGGDRCGETNNLHNTKEWERLIYQIA